MARKVHEMAHVSPRQEPESQRVNRLRFQAFHVLNRLQIRIMARKKSPYLSRIAVNEFIFDSFDVWALVCCCL